jgi:hypothetical protein
MPARDRTVGSEEEVVLLIDEHARDSGQVDERPQEGARPAVDHVHAICTGVRDVHARTTGAEPHVCVVEARLRSGRYDDEADLLEAHTLPIQLAPGAFPASTSALHHA